MSQITPWFTRNFPFPISVELLPNVSARLRGTPARLEEVFRNADVDALTGKPQGGWSIQEHVGHLLDIEPLWLLRVEDYMVGNRRLAPTDLQNKKTDDANHNARPLVEILHGFRAVRMMLQQKIESLDVLQFTGRIEHPRLQVPMGIVDHLYFVAEHDDHHLATIHSLLSL